MERLVVPILSEPDTDHAFALKFSYPAEVPFPRLDAFPPTLLGPYKQPVGICAALVATSETSARLKEMGQLIRSAIDTETREALLNDLAELGEAYEDGWQSGSDSGGDE
jgi:hypothetical protein